MIKMIKDKIAIYKDELIQLTKEMVQIDSVIFNEKEIIDFLANKMVEYGYDEVIVDDMGNLIGRIGDGNKVIAIDGHVDTVEQGDLANWEFDPLKGKEDDKIIFGRGSCDQKGGVASAIFAGRILKEIGLPKDTKLYVVCSILEEFFEGMNWQFIIDNKLIKPDVVILTEPSGLELTLGHRGRCDINVSVKGISSHGSEPDKGENAIYKMNEIITDLMKLHSSLPTDEIFGKDTLAVTKVRSEAVSINAVPDGCSIIIDRRLSRNDTLESVLKEIRNLKSVKKHNAEVKVAKSEGKSYSGFAYSVDCFYPTWILNEEHPMAQKAKMVYKTMFAKDPQIKYWRFSTNGVATMGKYNIPTIGFGPGEEKYAHTSEEQLPKDHLIKALEFYISFCLEFSK
ncbi:MAG: YgeY family selenium metabolism-linked hydrolase [Asgard group archaeon]|nr:YgeY family selenium metabolism-linked hydrolase [Asgard group archaeon]